MKRWDLMGSVDLRRAWRTRAGASQLLRKRLRMFGFRPLILAGLAAVGLLEADHLFEENALAFSAGADDGGNHSPGDLQAEMNASLREHMRRTELAETGIENLVRELRPVQQHVLTVRGVSKLIGALVAGAAAIATVWAAISGGR